MFLGEEKKIIKMKCEKCDKKAVILNPSYCKEHFNNYILNTVQETIEKFELFTKESKICVAVSGGKDSLALVDVLSRLNYNVEGLFIDEGIKNYREFSNADLDKFMKEKNISIKKTSFKELTNHTLDEAMNTGKFHACTICGTIRRYLLNKYSKEYDVIATGHNLDDEAQTIIINLARGNTDLILRGGLKSEKKKEFTQKVKPLIFITEKQLLTYAILRKIKSGFEECPYASTSYRANLRDALNKEESKNPGTKKNIINTYLKLKNNIKKNEEKVSKKVGICELCGEASQEKICKACKFKTELKELLD